MKSAGCAKQGGRVGRGRAGLRSSLFKLQPRGYARVCCYTGHVYYEMAQPVEHGSWVETDGEEVVYLNGAVEEGPQRPALPPPLGSRVVPKRPAPIVIESDSASDTEELDQPVLQRAPARRIGGGRVIQQPKKKAKAAVAVAEDDDDQPPQKTYRIARKVLCATIARFPYGPSTLHEALMLKSHLMRDAQCVYAREAHEDGGGHIHFFCYSKDGKFDFDNTISVDGVEYRFSVHNPSVHAEQERGYLRYLAKCYKVHEGGVLAALKPEEELKALKPKPQRYLDPEQNHDLLDLWLVVNANFWELLKEPANLWTVIKNAESLEQAVERIGEVNRNFQMLKQYTQLRCVFRDTHATDKGYKPPVFLWDTACYDKRLDLIKMWIDRYVLLKDGPQGRHPVLIFVGPSRSGKSDAIVGLLRSLLVYSQGRFLAAPLLDPRTPEAWPVVLDDLEDEQPGGLTTEAKKEWTQTKPWTIKICHRDPVSAPARPVVIVANEVPVWSYSKEYWAGGTNCWVVEFKKGSQPLYKPIVNPALDMPLLTYNPNA